MASSLTLVANPGSASRKYALFSGQQQRASVHFEWRGNKVVCSVSSAGNHSEASVAISNLESAAGHLIDILHKKNLLAPGEAIGRIGVRVVAPGTYFTEHRVVTQHFVDQLQVTRPRAPLHIVATLQELKALHQQFPHATIVGASDSAFHSTKPDYAQYYGIPLAAAKKFDIKRFGYHGLSAESVVHQLKQAGKLTPRLVIAHLGSGASVTAVYRGKSVDTTMGYSPLEGVTMSTRSGSIDFTAAKVLKDQLGLSNASLEEYLNKQSGLLGLGGSADIRELLKREDAGNKPAKLAMQIYIFNLQKAIGQMVAVLGGVDALVFTGTVGERNPHIRQRLLDRLDYVDFFSDAKKNRQCTAPSEPTLISRLVNSKPIFVVPANEAAEIARVAERT